MSWFDQVAQAGYQLKAGLKTAKDHLLEHPGEQVQQLKNIWQQQKQEQQALAQQRQESTERIAALKDPNQFRNMNHDQRAAQVHEVAGQMPDRLTVAHAHPGLRVLTAPFRIGWSAVTSLGKAKTAVAAHITEKSNTYFIILALVYHLFVNLDPSLTLWDRLIYNLIMFIVVIFVIFDASERNGDTYRTLLLWVIIFEILIPFLSTLPMVYDIKFVRLYLANSFLIWTWVYYAVLVRGKNVSGGLTRLMRWAIFTFWILVAISSLGILRTSFSDVELNNATTEQFYAAGLIWDKAGEGWSVLLEGIKSSGTSILTVMQYQWKHATGADYYYGVVEENENEKLGVYLEDLKASQTEYEENDPVTVFATLTARTLDDIINTKIACYAGNKKSPIAGIVYPDTAFEISNLQQEELDCSFEKLPEGTNKVTYTADFNFQTIGYLKRYFADRDAIIAATRQNIDLLNEYQIQDTNPVAHYTNGPVAIGMGPEQALIGVSETYTVKPRLALTLDGNAQGWGGKITQLTEVVLLLPEQMSLDTTQCTDADWSAYTLDTCVASETTYDSKVAQDCAYDSGCIEEKCTTQLTGYNAYSLDVNKSEYTDIKDYITISCRLNVDDVDALLGATPISTKYFYVKTRYAYQITEDTSVKVTEQESAHAGTVSGETSTSKSEVSSVPTFDASEADEEMQYIFYHYGEYLFAAAEKFTVPVCTVAGLIAETSSANPNYYQDGRKGLMGLPDSLSKQVSTAAGYTGSYNIYDAQTNINLGAVYLQKIIQDLGGYTDAVPIAYYDGIYRLNPDETSTSNEEADLYATHVKNFAGKYCADVGLDNSKISTTTQHADDPFLEGSLPLSSFTAANVAFDFFLAQNAADSSGKKLHFSIVQTERTGLKASLYYDTGDLSGFIYSLTLKKGYIDSSDSVLSFNSDLTTWHTFDSYVLLAMIYDASTQAYLYRFPQDFIINTDTLLEDEPAVVIPGVLYLEYTGSTIDISTVRDPANPENREDVCSVKWYEDIAYATCKEDDLPGLILRNVRTVQNTLGSGYAKLQIEWNTTKQLEGFS